MDLPPPPSFAGAELQRFDVPEGCHICFLHLGFQDPAPRCDPVLATPDSTASRRAFPGGAVAAANFTFPRDDNIPDYDDLASDHEEDESGPGHASRGFMRDHCPRSGEARYAIKHVRSDLGGGEEEAVDAAVDLAREAEFLAALKHPNVIWIRGTIGAPGHPKFSLVFDRLYDTLGVQMTKWRAERKRHRGKFKGLIGKNQAMLDTLWHDQMVASYDLSRAMAYLHSRG